MRSLIITGIILLSYSIPAHSDSCSTQEGRVAAYRTCFANEGILADDVFDWYRNYAAPGGVYEVPTERLFSRHGDRLCVNHTQAFKNAIQCSYRTDVNCAPPAEQDILVRPDLMATTIDPLCAKRKEIDFDCALAKHSDLLRCAHEKARQHVKPGMTYQQLKCLSYRLLTECTKIEFKSCGCMTSKIYSDIALDLLTPETCPTEVLRENRVVCDETDVKSFKKDGLGNGGKSRRSAYVPLFLLPVLVGLAKIV